MNCQVSRTVLLLVFYFCQGGHSTISKNSHHHHVTITKEDSRRGMADSLQSHQQPRQLQPQQNPVKIEDGVKASRLNAPHLVLKFHDLPPWTPARSRRGLEPENGKREKANGSRARTDGFQLQEAKAKVVTEDDGHGITLDLRSYNPLTAHLLTQSYIYPTSNGLTQTDREYFAMIQSETGTSDVHFEKGGVGGRGDGTGGEDVRVEESKIKGLASVETADGVSRQLAASDCSIGPCGSSIEGSIGSSKASLTTSNIAEDPSVSSPLTSTASPTNTRTTATKKPLPRFAYHRVPGSFAAFRLIKPAFTEEPPAASQKPSSAFDSFHDDEPPSTQNLFEQRQRASRDVAAVHLV